MRPKRRNATGHSNAFQFHCVIMNGQIHAGKYPGQDLPPSIRENFEDMKLVKDEDEIISGTAQTLQDGATNAD